MNKHHCIVCNNIISNKASYCRSCSKKLYYKCHPERNPAWKGGIPKCKDCGKQLKSYNSKRCSYCANKDKNNPMYGKIRPEHSKRMGGQNNPNYVHGNAKKPYPYIFSLLKKSILHRDQYTCQNCNLSNEEHKCLRGYGLVVHHIDYNKQNCQMNNLITLCHSCNIKANFNRKYWIMRYTEIIHANLQR